MAHDASIDRTFSERLCPEATGKTWMCSMDGVPWRQKGFGSRALQSLLSDHGIRPEKAHRGLSDVRSALQLLSCTDEDGVCYFRYLLDRQSERCGDRESTARAKVARATRTAATPRAARETKTTRAVKTIQTTETAGAPRATRASRSSGPSRAAAPARESRGFADLVSLPFRAAWRLVRSPFDLVRRVFK